MTTAVERTAVEVTQDFLTQIGAPRVSLEATRPGVFVATCFWPNGDVCKDTHCWGQAPTLAEALAAMWAKVEEAKNAVPILKTAAECKAAVIALIQEHEAAPASFRDAVDALPVRP